METQSTPPEKRSYKNGVDHAARARPSFAPRSWSFLWRAKVEALVALSVIAGVVGIFIYLVQIPGALVVRLVDDGKRAVPQAIARCRHPATGVEMVGETDVFGEAKFAGLDRGTWTCEVRPPDRFFSPPLTASGEVRPRQPAILEVRAQRAVDVAVSLVRPEGAPRAAVAVRALCPSEGGKPVQGWESRTGVLDSSTTVYLPPDRSCRIGLLPGSQGQVYFTLERAALDCSAMPCGDPLSGRAGQHLSVTLKPTRAQWETARPPAEPDSTADAGSN